MLIRLMKKYKQVLFVLSIVSLLVMCNEPSQLPSDFESSSNSSKLQMMVYVNQPVINPSELNFPENITVSNDFEIPQEVIEKTKAYVDKGGKNTNSLQADINTAQVWGYVLYGGTTGLNHWHVVCYDMNWTIIASRETYTHPTRGQGYYDAFTAETVSDEELFDEDCVRLYPPYRVLLWDNDWVWWIALDNIYLCPGRWRWNWTYAPLSSSPNCTVKPTCIKKTVE